ncbi:DNA sulfur modification protein DndB [Bacillus sp. T33-2]|uniref:DNA sulfur modification protein DndB n=1 Tax=Bacillus sp. T33-2 TaxID=2054168 RepID=UPI000C781F29|nr:DNA sulfur modification protein DndB [Bacillus sp. T33-2]PLR95895.1 hypothetical protein CVD19_12780 [Bacillus sp. T33-2]
MIINEVFSKRQSIAAYTIQELSTLIRTGDVTLREVNKLHVRSIKKYILENVSQEQIYFPPVVANVPSGELDNGKPKQFTVIDGNQRLKALCQLEEMAQRAIMSDKDDDIKKGYKLLVNLKSTEVGVLFLEGLTDEEAGQLYIDLNTKGKKVSLSKRIAFDSRNELNQITNKLLKTNQKLNIAGIEAEKRAVIRPKNKNLLSLTQLRQIVAIFITGRMVYRVADDGYHPYLQFNEYVKLLDFWFDELFHWYPPETIGNFEESMLANTTLLLSIAYYANKGLENKTFDERKEELVERMRPLKALNWKRTNPVWKEFKGDIKGRERYFYLSSDKENIERLVAWLEQQGR